MSNVYPLEEQFKVKQWSITMEIVRWKLRSAAHITQHGTKKDELHTEEKWWYYTFSIDHCPKWQNISSPKCQQLFMNGLSLLTLYLESS